MFLFVAYISVLEHSSMSLYIVWDKLNLRTLHL